MHRRFQPLSITLFVIDLLLVPVGLALATLLRSTLPIGVGGALPGENAAAPWLIYVMAIICWGVGMTFSGVYDPQRSLRWFNEAWRVLWGNLLSAFLMAGLLYLTFRELSRLQFVYFTVVSAVAMLAYRGGFRLIYRTAGRARPGGRTRILVVGAGDLGGRLGQILLDHSRWGFEPVGYLDDDPAKLGTNLNGLEVLGSISDLTDLVHTRHIDEVWTALPLTATSRLQDIMRALERVSVRVKVVPDYFSMALVQANVEILDGIPVIGLRDPLIEGAPRLMKRVFDLAVSFVLLILASPVLVIAGVALRLDSSGPVSIRQQRVGENGRLFNMLNSGPWWRTPTNGLKRWYTRMKRAT